MKFVFEPHKILGKLLNHLKGEIRVDTNFMLNTHSQIAVLRWKSELRLVSPNLAVVCPFMSSSYFHAACCGIRSPEGSIGLLTWKAPS